MTKKMRVEWAWKMEGMFEVDEFIAEWRSDYDEWLAGDPDDLEARIEFIQEVVHENGRDIFDSSFVVTDYEDEEMYCTPVRDRMEV